MIDILSNIFMLLLVIASGYIAYMSSVLVSEKKARYKAGTHDYYDNLIKNKDE